jgi:sugar phosphate isomerase/epimerase
MPIVGFTKSFQDWTVERVAREFKGLGLEGLDLTVRKGGHVLPENVDDGLAMAVHTAKDNGLAIPFITTDITEPTPAAERTLHAAAVHGIRYFKLGYYKYVPFGTLARQMDEVRAKLAQVVELAKKFEMMPCVHIHSGFDIPSHGTMLYQLIKDISPSEIGAYVDPLHMTLEGGGAGWQQGLDLLAPWIKLVAIKNFAWERAHRDKVGQQRWETHEVPLEDGVAPLPDFVALLKKLGYNGVYSLHSEYKGKHSFRDMSTDECLAQTKSDLAYFRKLL